MRTAVCAAGAAAMALTVAVMAAAQAEEKWGVIAVGPSKEWRISFGYPNYSTALYWARYFIRGGREVLAFRDCGALVQNDTGLSAARARPWPTSTAAGSSPRHATRDPPEPSRGPERRHQVFRCNSIVAQSIQAFSMSFACASRTGAEGFVSLNHC
jgi:hypothetical protein